MKVKAYWKYCKYSCLQFRFKCCWSKCLEKVSRPIIKLHTRSVCLCLCIQRMLYAWWWLCCVMCVFFQFIEFFGPISKHFFIFILLLFIFACFFYYKYKSKRNRFHTYVLALFLMVIHVLRGSLFIKICTHKYLYNISIRGFSFYVEFC